MEDKNLINFVELNSDHNVIRLDGKGKVINDVCQYEKWNTLKTLF